jgi:hypothetical protein
LCKYSGGLQAEQLALWQRKEGEAADELRALGDRPGAGAGGARAAGWTAKRAFYTHELKRYRVYIAALAECAERLTEPPPADDPSLGASRLRRPLSPPVEVC